MKKLRPALFGILVLVLLGAAGLAASGGRGESGAGSTGSDLPYPDDGVSAAVDQALGRPSSALGHTSAAQASGDAPRNSAQIASAPAITDAIRGGTAGKALPESVAAPVAPDQNLALASTDDRKIVQTGSVNLQVKDVGGVFQEIGQIASAAGGYIAGSNFALQGDRQIATASIRVPANRYQEVLGQVRALGVKVEAESSNASDVTQEYSDLAARQRTLEATQAQLLTFLGQTKNVSEALQVQDRLNSIQTQIEQAKGRIQLLDKLSDFATLTVHLRPVATPVRSNAGTDLGARISEAWEHSLRFLGDIAGGVLSVIVFGWWVPVLAVPAILVLNRLRRTPVRPVQAYD